MAISSTMKKLFSATLLIACSYAISGANPPQIHTNASFDERILYRAISDNGRWAVAERRPDYDGGKIIDLSDYSYVTITCENKYGEVGRPLDVTDDGEMAVGAYGIPDRPQPAVWHRSTGKWSILAYPDNSVNSGYVHAVTPDGHWAVGRVMGAVNQWTEMCAIWDLTTGEFISLPGLPAPHLDTFNADHNRFTAISPDGRYIVAELTPGGSVIYDREQGKYYAPEGKLTDGRTARVSVTDMSPSGRYLHGRAHISGVASATDDDTWSNECIYDMTDGSVTLLRDSGLADHMTWGVADDGTLYAGVGGNGTPMRDFHIYSNGYWYPLDEILWQAYGIDYYALTQLSNTGTPYAFSSDGKTFASFTDPNRGEGWVMKFDESISDACKRVDLMANFATAPAKGAHISSLSTVVLGFDRNVEFNGQAANIKLYDGEGELLGSALGGSCDQNKLSITFRRKKQGAGLKYRVFIPAGMINMAGTPSLKNHDINIEFLGRDDVEVPMSKDVVSELTLRCLDYSANYLTLPFESEITLTENASAQLIRREDGVKLADLALGVSGNSLLVYSTATLPLYRNSDYNVVVSAGSFTDPGGASSTANSEFSILIHGNWEDEPIDDTILLSEDFNMGLGNKFMFYEGDKLTPSAAMKAWGFEAETTPWWIARDDVYSSDYAAVSHSSYVSGGQSDDWMVTRRMRIPDASCRLTFDSQSYLEGMEDHLKVYVIPSDKVYTGVTTEAYEEFMANRVLIYDEVQTPGANQETLEGEWLHNDISLSEFAGKNVYIAFVNDNLNGSAVFVDNVTVAHDMTFSLMLTGRQSVVAAESHTISGRLLVNSQVLEFDDLTLNLLDSKGKQVSEVSLPEGFVAKAGNPFEFTFPQALMLEQGKVNPFTITVAGKDVATSFDREVSNLLFNTTKHAVLEEYSGAACGNCPDGIIVMEKLAADFGDKFIPLTIRAYMGDELTPENGNYSSLLGLEALGAPSGTVNRRYGGYPVERASDGTISYHTGDVATGLWYDFVANELSIDSYADISGVAWLEEGSNDILNVDAKLKFALDCDNSDYSLLAVMLEDNVQTYQKNDRSGSTDPFHGEWGVGGIYGRGYVYPYYCNDVVRNVSHSNLVGQPGLIPAKIMAGAEMSQTLSIKIPNRGLQQANLKVALLLIDNHTGYVENAVLLPVKTSGVVNVNSDGNAHVSVKSDGICVESLNGTDVRLYDVSGREIAHGAGESVMIPSPTNGVFILKVTTKEGITQSRVLLF